MNRCLATAAASALMTLAAAPAVPEVRAQDRVREMMRVNTEVSYLGVEMQEVTPDNMASYKLSAERGVIVRFVEKGSPASDAGLAEKDVILEYDGQPVVSTMQLGRLVRETPAGRKVPLGVSRDGKKVNLTVKIGKREGPILLRSEARPGFRPDRPEREFGFDGKSFRFESPDGRGFGFAIPDPRGGIPRSAAKPRLGVTLQELTDQLGEHLGVPGKRGALVTSVAEGSAAATAGLKAGDVIIRVDDRSVDSPEDVARAVERTGDEKLDLRIIRDKKETTITVTLPGDGQTRARGFRV
jgi:serine protease Do